MTTLKEDILIQKILLCDKDAELSELKKELLNIKVIKIKLYLNEKDILKQIEKGNWSVLDEYSSGRFMLEDNLMEVIAMCDKGTLRDALIGKLIEVQGQSIWERFLKDDNN